MLTAIHLLAPNIPLMFMGEEYDETQPFQFFAGFTGDLADAVRDGRRQEFADFTGFDGDAADVPDPIAQATFEGSKLVPDRRDSSAGQAALNRTRHLLGLRHAHIVPLLRQGRDHAGRVLLAERGLLAVDWHLDGAVLQVRANFAGDATDMPPATGTILNQTGPSDQPGSVTHWLKETG